MPGRCESKKPVPEAESVCLSSVSREGPKEVEEKLRQRMAELESINALSLAVTSRSSVEEVVAATLNQIMKSVSPDLALIYLLVNDEEMQLKGIMTSRRVSAFDKPVDSFHNVGECLCGLTALNSEILFSLDIHDDSRCSHFECRDAGLRSYASIPLLFRDNIIGVLGVGECEKRDFSVQESFLQSLAALISTAVANTMLNMKLREHTDELERIVAERTVELRKFFNAVEASQASIVITDIKGNIEYANPFFTNLTGYTIEEARGSNPRILKSGVHDESFYSDMWSELAAGRRWRGEICNRKKSGEIYWEDVSISPLTDESGNIINYVGVKEDITDRKISERILQESEQRYRTICNLSIDGIIIADQKTMKILYCNDAATRMMGYDIGELEGRSVFDIHPEEALPFVVEQIELQSGGVISSGMEIPCIKRDGTLFYCDVNGTRVEIDGISCSMGFFRDVTERRRSRELRDDVERILRHDLKAPLNSIIGFPQLMIESDNLTDSQKSYLKIIIKAGQNMLDMINLSLVMHQIESGNYRYTADSFDLVALIKECISACSSLCMSKKIDIDMRSGARVVGSGDRVIVKGERLLSFSIFSNLVINAIEASPRSEVIGITINSISPSSKGSSNGEDEIRSEKSDSEKSDSQMNDPQKSNSQEYGIGGREDGCTVVSIRNRGSVPVAIREKFFDKYITLGKSNGTGLGTYSAKLLAEAQGWDIEMRTSDTDGTELIVKIWSGASGSRDK